MSAEPELIMLAILCSIFIGLSIYWIVKFENLRKKYSKICGLTSNFIIDRNQSIGMSETEVLNNLEKYFVTATPDTRVDSVFDSDVLDVIEKLKEKYKD